MHKTAFFREATIETSVQSNFYPDIFLDCQYAKITNRNYQDTATSDNIKKAALMVALP